MGKVKVIKVPRYKKLISLLISLFILIIPFISHLKIMILEDRIKEVFTDSNGIYIDLFLYYKKSIVILFAIFIVLFFIGERIFPDYKLDYPLKRVDYKKVKLYVFIYLFMVIVSYTFSEYKKLAYMGSPTDGEGLLVLISYMILFLSGINYFNNEKSIKHLEKSIVLLILILILLSILEFFYKPIFEIPFFQKLLASKEYYEVLSSIKNNDYKDMVSLTLYNPNYFGGLCVLLFPIIMNLFINEDNKIKKVFFAILASGLIFCVFSSKSTAAIYIMILELIFLIIYSKRKIYKHLKFNVIYLILIIVISIILNFISGNKLFNVAIKGLKNSPSIESNREKFYLENINIYGDRLEIIGENNSLNIVINRENKNQLNFYDKNMDSIDTNVDKGIYSFKNNDFRMINVIYLEYGIIVDIGYNDTMEFYIKDGVFKGVGQNGQVIDNIKREKYFLKNLYGLATGRGYVWINTMPLIKDNFFLGTGPATFAMYFKQNDYIGLMNTHGSTKFIIDKPHNTYLQIAQQTGVISLISIIMIFYIFIKRAFNTFFKKKIYSDTQMFSLGFGVFIGIVGFLIISLVNDSIVTVSPIFWILLGVGFSMFDLINIKLKV
ncbi:O-antigen ligase family protein [Clostridium sp.]|uniref:O-antigen ligase family protein n=1 Tax=Clostridium sp. TaxID=1506 RepID=UPI001EBDFF8F|nr:O-antigen ligase family protein [Clostridium sp.]MBS5886844.1 O-antigen ligase family protein [Clostridium sp.]